MQDYRIPGMRRGFWSNFIAFHVIGASLFAAAIAVTCRQVFLLPFWVGGFFGLLAYTAILLGIRHDDRDA